MPHPQPLSRPNSVCTVKLDEFDRSVVLLVQQLDLGSSSVVLTVLTVVIIISKDAI